jgi:hypothetical protein
MKAKIVGIMLLVALMLVGVGTTMAAGAENYLNGALVFPDPMKFYDYVDVDGNVVASIPAYSAWEEFWVLIPEFAGAESYHVRVWIVGPAAVVPFAPSLAVNPGWTEVIAADQAGLLDADDGAGIVYRDYHLWAEDQYAWVELATGMIWYRLFIDATILQSFQFHYISVVPELAAVTDPDGDGWYDYVYTPILNADGTVPVAYSGLFDIAYPDDPDFPITWPANADTQY